MCSVFGGIVLPVLGICLCTACFLGTEETFNAEIMKFIEK